MLMNRWNLVYLTSSRFFVKMKAFGTLFWKSVCLSTRKNPNEQLSCFTFFLIRPLRASKLTYQIIAETWPEKGSFGLVRFVTSLSAGSSSTAHCGTYNHMQRVSNVQHIPTCWTNVSMQPINPRLALGLHGLLSFGLSLSNLHIQHILHQKHAHTNL